MLLRSALSRAEPAAEAWGEWRRHRTVESADVEEHRLLSVIAVRLGSRVTDDPSLRLLSGHRRYSFTYNAVRVAAASEITDDLLAGGIESVGLKGLALLPFYGNLSIRSMNDADLLVRWHQRHEAIDRLAATGYVPLGKMPLEWMHRLDRTSPGYAMSRPGGIEVDLHWRPLHGLGAYPELDEQIFTESMIRTVAGTSVRVPNPSHHVVLCLGHGMRFGSHALLMSIVDACQLMADPAFSAEQCISLAVDYERVSALRRLCDILEMTLSDGVNNELSDVPSRVAELRTSLPRRSITDVLLDRHLMAARSSTSSARGVWLEITEPPLLRGGPLAGAMELARKGAGVDRARDLPSQAIWKWSGQAPWAVRFRRSAHDWRGEPPTIRLGERISAVMTQGFERTLTSGWWGPDPEHGAVWSSQSESTIEFDNDLPPGSSCNVALTTSAFVCAEHPVLRVLVLVSGEHRATWCAQ